MTDGNRASNQRAIANSTSEMIYATQEIKRWIREEHGQQDQRGKGEGRPSYFVRAAAAGGDDIGTRARGR
jgi:hypothetical protein